MVQFDPMMPGRLRYHEEFAIPLEHKRVGQVIILLQDGNRPGGLACVVDNAQDNRSLIVRKGRFLVEDVVLVPHPNGKGIGPIPIHWRNQRMKGSRRRSIASAVSIGQRPMLTIQRPHPFVGSVASHETGPCL